MFLQNLDLLLNGLMWGTGLSAVLYMTFLILLNVDKKRMNQNN